MLRGHGKGKTSGAVLEVQMRGEEGPDLEQKAGQIQQEGVQKAWVQSWDVLSCRSFLVG
jgi:hypothetical protein